MAIEQVKPLLQDLKVFFDQIENSFGSDQVPGDFHFRDQLVSDVIKFISYLAAVDGILAEEERAYLSELTDLELSIDQMQIINEHYNYTDVETRTLFVIQPLKSYLLCLWHDRNASEGGGNMYDSLVDFFRKAGVDVIALNGEVSMEEANELMAFLAALDATAKSALDDPGFAIDPVPDEGDKFDFFMCQGEEAVMEEAPSPMPEEMPIMEEAPAPMLEEAPMPEEMPIMEEVDAPVMEEAPVPVLEEMPVMEEAPAPVLEEAPMPEEMSMMEETPAFEEAPAPALEEAPVLEEMPIMEEVAAPVLEEMPIMEEAPAFEEAPAPMPEEIPVMEEATAPVMEEVPVLEEMPVMEEAPAPVLEEAPVSEEMPIMEEAPLFDEVPSLEEASMWEEAPMLEETPAFEEAPVTELAPFEEAPTEIALPTAFSVEEVFANVSCLTVEAVERKYLEISIGESGSCYIAICLSPEQISSLFEISVDEGLPAMLIGNQISVAYGNEIFTKNLASGDLAVKPSTAEVVSGINGSIMQTAKINLENSKTGNTTTDALNGILGLMSVSGYCDQLNDILSSFGSRLNVRSDDAGHYVVIDNNNSVHSLAEVLIQIDREG